MCGDAPRLPLLRLGALDQTDDFGRNPAVQRNVLLEQRQHAVGEGARLGARGRLTPENGRSVRADERPGGRVPRHLRARKSFDQNARASVGKPHNLEYASEHAGAMQVGRTRLLGLALFLGDEKDELVGLDGRIDCRQRCRTADEQRDDYIWKDNDVAKRENGYAVARLHRLTVAQSILGSRLWGVC